MTQDELDAIFEKALHDEGVYSFQYAVYDDIVAEQEYRPDPDPKRWN